MKNKSWAINLYLVLSRASLVVLAVGSMLVVGCGGQSEVSGKVTYKGEPVKGGSLIFNPVGDSHPGKAATAEVQSDGTYTLGTYEKSDGAVAGQYRVIYTPPEPKLTEEQRTDPKYIAPQSPYAGLAPKQEEVTVNAGANTIDIELVPKRKR